MGIPYHSSLLSLLSLSMPRIICITYVYTTITDKLASTRVVREYWGWEGFIVVDLLDPY